MNSTDMQKFVAGKYSKKTSYIYLSFVLGIFFIFLVIAIAAYPPPYSIFTNAISNLGNRHLNLFPGWLWFSIGLWIFGPATLPHFFYQYRALKRTLKWAASIFLVCSIISSIGMVGVGIFSEDANFPMHVAFAAMVFGGMLLASLFSWFSIIAMIVKEKNVRLKKVLCVVLVFMVVIVVGVAVTISTVYVNTDTNAIQQISFLSIKFWEWMLFLTLIFQTILLTVLINLNPE